MSNDMLTRSTLWAALALAIASPALGAPLMRVAVDVSQAPQHILHTRLVIPATPGALTLVYPKWIPGEHGPTGPIDTMAGLHISARGRTLAWRRDDEDMFAFHVEVPGGAAEVEVTFDVVSAPGGNFTAAGSSSAELAVVSWNQVVVYPRGTRPRDLTVAASLALPVGWHLGTALPLARQVGTRAEFGPVSLETLVDSPVLAGQLLRTIDLSPGATPPHRLHVAGDSAAALELGDEVIGHYRRLVTEAGALFGARHYRAYDFLLSLSEHVAHFGLEHHQSSDNRQRERVFLDEALRVTGAGLLPHEYVHSWNGKFRRPAGLATTDYQQPMKGDLLWIYEGLTTYLGEVLTARSGLRTPEQEREAIALTAAALDVAPGRTWRSLGDTAVAAQILYGGPIEWRSWRRGVDFYPESELIWLEADTVIRQKTAGQKSLDDFCRAFHGKTGGPPTVEPYVLDDVLAALNTIAPNDWRAFFAARVDRPTTRAPLGGIEAAGWRLVYRETPSSYQKLAEQAGKSVNLSFSIGLLLDESGRVLDAIPGSPAARAGVAPGMKVIAVNGRRFTTDVVREAVKDSKTRGWIELIVENGDYYDTHKISYRGGARYPTLERIAGKNDLLEAILGARVR
jgi:predicted metalloprotease with PDZ domain